MIPIYNELEVHYTIEQELALVGDITAEINTKYISQGSHALELPDVDAVPLGSVVVLEQQSGTGIINDRVSHYGLTDEGGTLNTTQVETGETVAVYLHTSFGRKQWVQISSLLFIVAGTNYAAIQEIFTVLDIASRDALPLGGGVSEVSDGDIAIVLDYDGQGTKQNYQYFAASGWIIATELTSVYTETFFATDIAGRDALPTGVGVNNVSVGDNVIVADGDGAGTKMVFQWTGAGGYVLVFSEGALADENFTVADLAARDALIIGPGDGEVSNGDTVKVMDYDGYGNMALYTYYTDQGYVLTSTYGMEALLTLGAESKELSGFVDNDAIVSSYDSTTRRVTLTHPSGTLKYIWQNSVRSLVSPWVSDPHPDVAGNYFLMMNDGETPVWLTVPWDFSVLPMAFVTYDAVPGLRMGVNENHGIMPYELHRTNHINIGTWKERGSGKLTDGTYSIGVGNNNAAITPGVDIAYVNDEDIRSQLAALIEGNYTVHYLSGVGTTNILFDQPVPFRTNGTFIFANQLSGGVYADIPLTNGDFVNIYCIFVPAMADAISQKYRFIFQTGQHIYTSLDAALAEQPYDLNLGDMALLSNEYTLGFKLTYQARNANSTTGKVQLDRVTYIEGTRASLVASQSTADLTESIYSIADRTLEATGFYDNKNIDVSYNKVARTVTLTHPSGLITYLWRDRIRQLTSPWTSAPHADAPGQYFLKSQDGTTFIWDSTTMHEPYDQLHVAHVTYQLPAVGDSGCIREVHGFMQHETQHELHHIIGTWKQEDTGLLTAATYLITPAAPIDADNTPGVDETILYDEDVETVVPALIQGSYTLHHLGVAGASTLTKSSTFPFRVSGNDILANIKVGDDYTDVPVHNGKLVNVYCLAMPMASDADSQEYRYIWHQGQEIFDSLDIALSSSPANQEFGDFGVLATEAAVICKLTYRRHSSYTTTGKCRIENVQYYAGAAGSLSLQPVVVLPSHTHSSLDVLGFPIENTGTVEVLHGYCVGIDGAGNYRLYTDNTYTFVGINTNNDAPVGNIMHIEMYDITEAAVINAATLSHGDPLRIDLATGKLTLYTPGEKITPVVATFVEDVDGTLAHVHGVDPLWPKRYSIQLTSMGLVTPGSTNILQDDYEGGKLIFAGNEAYLLRARAKYKVPSALQADLNIYRNADVPPIFSDLLTPSASPDTYGNWQDTLTGLVSTSLFKTDDEVRFTDESAGAIDGEDLTILLEFEERVLWNTRP